MKGNHAGALEEFRKTVETDPNNVVALNSLAYLLSDFSKKPDEALKYAQKAQELAPDVPVIEDTLGWILYTKGIYDGALKHLERGEAGRLCGLSVSPGNGVRQERRCRKRPRHFKYRDADGSERSGSQNRPGSSSRNEIRVSARCFLF